jgi:ASCH domain
MRALSIRQPWAWLIVEGHKDIENRDWSTAFRGPVLIHAGKTMARVYYNAVALEIDKLFGSGEIVLPPYEALERGGVVGVANITGCVTESESPWFQGEFGFVLSDARPLPFHEFKGQLGYFDVPGLYP